MADLIMLVDTALAEVPVNIMPLLDDTDFKSREVAVAFDAAGMDLVWNFCTVGGAMSQTAVTPTSSGNYDWAHQGDGMYSIEIPASGGASINNDTEGFGWFTGLVTGVLPWRGPVIQFSPANVVNSLVVGSAQLLVDMDATARNAMADALLKRDWSGLTSEAARSALNALRFLRNKWDIAGSTLTVKKEDDSTTAWTADLTTDGAANPVTGSDPS